MARFLQRHPKITNSGFGMDITTTIGSSSTSTPNTASGTPITAASYSTLSRYQREFWASQAEAARKSGTDKVSLGFKDLVDLINPLQHIPLIRNIYQAVTGDDTMKPAIKFMGDTLFGGPLAAVSSGVDAVIKQASGKDMMETVVGWFSHDNHTTAVAANAADTLSGTIQTADTETVANPIVSAVTTASQLAVLPKYGLASTGPSPAVATPANAQPTAATIPSSTFFAGLQKNNASGTKMPPPPAQLAYFNPKGINPGAQQFASATSAALKMPDKGMGIADSTMPSAASVIPASTTAGINLTSNGMMDTPNNPQSDFAQKMMAAMDRYQAAKRAGNNTDSASSALSVSTGM